MLALVNPESNGFGADAVVLVYNAREKEVHSIDAEGAAPKLATIEWYSKNNDGKIPNSDGLLSASLPGVIDAWYIMLDRWGTMTFAQVLERAIDVADNDSPIGDGLSRAIQGSKKIRQYPSTMKVYFPNGRAPQPGGLFRNPDSARMLRKLVEAEKAAAGKGRREALRAARDRFCARGDGGRRRLPAGAATRAGLERGRGQDADRRPGSHGARSSLSRGRRHGSTRSMRRNAPNQVGAPVQAAYDPAQPTGGRAVERTRSSAAP